MVLYILILAFFVSCSINASYSSTCSRDEWACQTTRTCIKWSDVCDGKVDCRDRSDETHAVCRKNLRCPPFTFRCTYGACVDGNAKCNGTEECLDGSDEVLCHGNGKRKRVVGGMFLCDNGERIPSPDRCDGKADCADYSDESLTACAKHRCAPNLFQCRYGACVDEGAACDPYGTWHCLDGSDEADELCKIKDNRPSTICTLPDYPGKGTYTVVDHANENPKPGDKFKKAFLEVSCDQPIQFSNNIVRCEEGFWKEKMVKCTSFCKLPSNEGVSYRECQGFYRPRECNEYEPNGVQVYPKCLEGYRKIEATVIKCVHGQWDRDVKCEKETQTCGLPTAAQELIIEGSNATKYEVPWHAGIYDKSRGDHKLICGGTLVTPQLVISAAHCFWNDVQHQLPHTNYAVALGQLKRQWGSDGGQLFNVTSIKLPEKYQGETTMYRGDIALVFLDRPAEYHAGVRPVCLDLDNLSADQKQLADGKLGKVAGWGLTDEFGRTPDDLVVNMLPTVNNIKCINESHPDFKRYIDDDKLCAGKFTENALCEGDSGGGLVFRDGPGQPYYLRGVVSIRHMNDKACNKEGYTTFTRVFHYADFIRKYNNNTL